MRQLRQVVTATQAEQALLIKVRAVVVVLGLSEVTVPQGQVVTADRVFHHRLLVRQSAELAAAAVPGQQQAELEHQAVVTVLDRQQTATDPQTPEAAAAELTGHLPQEVRVVQASSLSDTLPLTEHWRPLGPD